MTENWYEPPVEKKTKPNWVKIIFVSIATGVLTGLIIAIMYILADYIFPRPRVFEFNLQNEISAALLVIMFGATLGLIIGAPAALLFGPITLKATHKLPENIKLIVRTLLGAIGGYLAFLILGITQNTPNLFILNIDKFFMPCAAGIIGALLFQKLYPKEGN